MFLSTYFRVSWTDDRLIWPFEGNTTDDGREDWVLDPDILPFLWNPDIYIEYSRGIEKFSVLENVQAVWMNKDKRILISTM